MQLAHTADRLSRDRFAGRAAGYDAAAQFPAENYDDLREAGLLGLRVPAEYGGLEVDPLTYAMCILAVARGCPSTALTLTMHTNVLGSFVGGLGTPEQQNWYFREAVDDGQLFASITSEPGASARERFVLSTIFTPEAGGGYRVTGTKHFCSLADAADYFFVTGIIAGSGGGSDNIVSAMIRSDMSGVAVTEQWDAVGMRATSSHTVSYNTVAPVPRHLWAAGPDPERRLGQFLVGIRGGVPGHRRGGLRLHHGLREREDLDARGRGDHQPSGNAEGHR